VARRRRFVQTQETLRVEWRLMESEHAEVGGSEPPITDTSDRDDMRDPPDDVGRIEMEELRGDDRLRPFDQGLG
jgi:hypothetical protein